MSEIYSTRKIIGSFIVILAIFILLFSVLKTLNTFDYIQEYNECIGVAEYEPETLTSCKEGLLEGIGFRVRENQFKLNIYQYSQIYIMLLIQLLFSLMLLTIGLRISCNYCTRKIVKPKPIVNVSKPKPKTKIKTKKKIKKK